MLKNKQLVPIFLITLLIQLSACVSSKPMNFTVASVTDIKIEYTVLSKAVIGQDCEGQYGSYEAATHNAIASVDGANALVNAKFSRKEMPIARICVTVTGDAVKI